MLRILAEYQLENMASVSTYGDPRHLLPNNYKALISAWLEEDCPSFDYGGFVVGESEGEARLLGKSAVRILCPLGRGVWAGFS